MKEFWLPFKKIVDSISVNVKKEDVTQEKLQDKCPRCGKILVLRIGRKGKFISCSGYPECDYAASIDNNKGIVENEVISDRVCLECGSQLHIKVGRYGKFIGCSNYPKCRFVEPLEKPVDTGVKCPVCNIGTLIKRKSRFNSYFYSCSQYPKCKYAVFNEPVSETCKHCGWPILSIKVTKKHGTQKVCPKKTCSSNKKVDK